MYNFLLKTLVKEFQNQNMSSFTMIYDEFKRLIYLYSGRLADDDAVQELTLFLIELIYSIDVNKFKSDNSDSLKRYIAVSLKNKYISISKENQRRKVMCDLCFENRMIFDKPSDTHLDIKEALNYLTEKQKIIIIYKYVYCLSDFEISSMLNISRQAVNRLKNRGIESLKEYYKECFI